jgi:hypothetical protein
MDEHHKKHGHEIQEDLKEHFDDVVDTFKSIKDPGKFEMGKEFMNALEVLKLNTKKMHDISQRKTTATAAFLFIVLAAIAMNLGIYLSFLRFDFIRPSFVSLLISGVIYIVLTIIMIFIYDFVGSRFFKGKGNYGELFRVLGYGNLVLVAGIIPMLSGLAGIWYLVVSYMALRTVKKLNPMHTIFTILITVIVGGALSVLITQLLGYGPAQMIGLDSSLFS